MPQPSQHDREMQREAEEWVVEGTEPSGPARRRGWWTESPPGGCCAGAAERQMCSLRSGEESTETGGYVNIIII